MRTKLLMLLVALAGLVFPASPARANPITDGLLLGTIPELLPLSMLIDTWFPPESDLAPLGTALQRANDTAFRDSWFNRVIVEHEFTTGCVKTSVVLAEDVFDVLNQGGFNGWRIRNLRALTGCHTVLLLSSPDGSRHYFLDNYLGFVQVARMQEFVPGQFVPAFGAEFQTIWFVHGGCNPGNIWKPIPETDTDFVDFTVGGAIKGGGNNLNEGCALRLRALKTFKVQGAASHDPNAKVGSQGVGEQQFISGAEPLRYEVFFENVETASAPAQEVLVSDRLDAAKIDLSSLSLSLISFGDHVISPPPGRSDYSTDVDLRPAKNLIVRISAHLDTATGVLSWRFRSLDPVTGQPPDDPLAGFLPPDTNPPAGEGSVLFTVMQKAGLATGTEIRNKATIVFDQNASIDTQEWLNTLDNSKPSSSVSPLPASETSPTFNVHWSGTDDGSGIEDYSVFVSEDGGPFTAWQLDTPDTSATFTGLPGKRYAFYSVARDRTGNLEPLHATADATTQVVLSGDTTPPQISCGTADGLWHATDVSINCTASDLGSGLANPAADASFSLTTHVPDGTETDNAQTDTRQVCDNAGNCAVAGPIGGNKVDRKGPSIALATPPADGSGDYLLNASVPANYVCSDGGSGMVGGSASCTGTVPNGSNIATSSVGSHSFEVRATDALGNATKVTTTYNVHATTSLLYNGQQIVNANSTLLLGAKLSSAASACVSGRTINFSLDGDPDGAGPMTAALGSAVTDSSGQATLSLTTANWTVGAVYTVTASYAGTAACLASSDPTGTLIVSSPGDSSDGGGWYTLSGSGRINLGFVVSKVPNTTDYTGQILFMNTGKWRLKGALDSYSKSGSSASSSGTGRLYYWNQSLNGGLGDWALSQSGVAFSISYTDGGSGGKTSSDTFGIIINHSVVSPPEPSRLPNSKPQPIKGGNITIR